MNLLAIETSTEQASIAILVDGIIHSKEDLVQRQHAHWLLPQIEQLLEQIELPLNQLQGIVFGRGPGSFTGLRIACAVAKGLAYAHDLPLYPVSGLLAITYKLYEEERDNLGVLAMLDARMHQVYWSFSNELFEDVAEYVSNPEEIVCVTERPIVIAGYGYEHYIAQLPQVIQSKIVKTIAVYPHASSMIHLVLSGRIKPVSAAEAEPVYIRNQVTQGNSNG